MRRLNYKVRNEFGQIFFTTDYVEATRNPKNRIIRTFLVEVDEKSPATRVWNSVHARKVWNQIAEKRA